MARVAGAMAFLAWPLLLGVAQGYSSFDSNCTLPDGSVNFVSSPPTRGTMDIIWSSLLALLSCTWAVQHLVVPTQKPDEEPKKESKVKSFLLMPLRAIQNYDWHKVKLMIITVTMPEYIVGKAMAEYASASYWEKEFEKIASPALAFTHRPTDITVGKRPGIAARAGHARSEWTKTHGFLANMRGLVLRFHVNAVPTDLTPKKPSKQAIAMELHKPRTDFEMPYERQDAEQAEAIEADMCRNICGVPCSNREHADNLPADNNGENGAIITPITTRITGTDDTSEKSPEGSDSPAKDDAVTLGPHKPWRGAWALSAAQWFHAYEMGLIRHLPAITKEEICDRSKSDLLVKVAAVFQIIWMIISIIARAFQNLDISLLEVTVVAFAAVAIVISLFFLEKPQDVGVPTYVDASVTLTREHVITLAAFAPASTIIAHEFWLHGVAVRDQAENVFPISPGLAVHTPFRKHPIYINPLMGIGIGGILFGTIHFAAWNFSFPTSVEKLLWRISCVLCVTLPPLATVLYHLTLLFGKLGKQNDSRMNKILRPMEILFAPVYLLSRMYITVEVVRQLAYLPPSAFLQVNWSAAIPHFA